MSFEMYQNFRGLPVKEFVMDSARLYQTKRGGWPKVARLNPADADGLTEIGLIKLVPDEATLKGHVLLGEAEDADETTDG